MSGLMNEIAWVVRIRGREALRASYVGMVSMSSNRACVRIGTRVFLLLIRAISDVFGARPSV